MTFFDFILVSAATMYLSEIITGKSGPFNVFAAMRARTGGLLLCGWCVAPWIAIVMLAIYYLLYPPIVWAFGVAGLAMAIRSYTGISHGG